MQSRTVRYYCCEYLQEIYTDRTACMPQNLQASQYSWCKRQDVMQTCCSHDARATGRHLRLDMMTHRDSFPIYIYIYINLTYSRWTSSLPSCLWSQRIFPSLPGSRLTTFYRDASSALLQLVNQWLNFTHSRSHAFRYERKNTNPTLVRTELTTSPLADVQITY